jgi:hypothetical protein
MLIFSDRWWDGYKFDTPTVGGNEVCHPIRCKKVVFDHFLSHFDPVLDNENPVAHTKHKGTGTYFIGFKKTISHSVEGK